METVIGKTKIEIVKGDVLTMSADAIVNPANARLIDYPENMAFGGLHLAIITQMGEKGQDDLWLIKQGLHGGMMLETQALVSSAGGMRNYKYVIHAVGPIWYDIDPETEEECRTKLAACYRNILAEAAKQKEIKTINFPSISTGHFNFPIEQAAPIVIQVMKEILPQYDFDTIRFALFSQAVDAYTKELAKM